MTDSIQQSVSQIRAQDAIFESQLDDIQLKFESMVGAEASEAELREEGNPLSRMGMKSQKNIEERAKVEKKAQSEAGLVAKPLTQKETQDTADEFARDNPGIRSKDLIDLLGRLSPGDKKEAILKFVFAQYPDLNEASKALEFLAKTTGSNLHKEVNAAKEMVFAPINSISPEDTQSTILEKLEAAYPYPTLVNQALDILLEKTSGTAKEQVQLAKDEIVANFGRDIKMMSASRQITSVLTKAKLDIPPGDFNKIASKTLDFRGLEAEMAAMSTSQKEAYCKALLHFFGIRLKQAGSSSEIAEIQDNINRLRAVQASLSTDKVAEKTVQYIHRLFNANELTPPPQLIFKEFRKEVIAFTAQHYPNPEQVAQMAVSLGFKKNIDTTDSNNLEEALINVKGQIIVFNAMLGMLPQLSPDKVFGTTIRRDEIRSALIAYNERLELVLENVEDQLIHQHPELA
jgi:hypothetical protein